MFRLSSKDLICAHFLTLNPAVSEAHSCEAGAPPVCYAAPPSCKAPLPLPARASLSSLEVTVFYNSLGCLFPCHLLQEVCLHWGIRHCRLLARMHWNAALCFSLHPDQRGGGVSSWKESHKLSSAFLLSTPSTKYGLSRPFVAEALATMLCLSTRICADRVG